LATPGGKSLDLIKAGWNQKVLIISHVLNNIRFDYDGPLQTTTSFDEEMSEDQDLDEDVLLELTRKAAAGRVSEAKKN
jgi:hypothetical protein